MLVIVGSSQLWLTPEVMGGVVGAIAVEPPGEVVGIRLSKGLGVPPSPVEDFVRHIGPGLGHVVRTWAAAGDGRSGVFKRDFEMVEAATRVIAFFSPGREMEGGTGHVVKAALDRGIPVEAYGLDDAGSLELIGSDDGRPSRGSRPEILTRMWEQT